MRVLDEKEAKKLLQKSGIPICPEESADDLDGLKRAVRTIGFPCVLKGVGENLAHKTEVGVVFCNLRDESEIFEAAKKIKERAPHARFLVQKHIQGAREFICGLIKDELFGPAVMFGVGGIMAEALKDAAFRLAPVSLDEAKLMLSDIRANKLLGEFRGESATDLDELVKIVVALGELAVENPEIAEIDLNPVIIEKTGKPVVVDYLVRLGDA